MTAKKKYDYSKIQIEHGIPTPDDEPRSVVVKFLPRLNVGDSFVITDFGMYSYLGSVAAKNGMKLRLRNISTPTKQEYRIWRIK